MLSFLPFSELTGRVGWFSFLHERYRGFLPILGLSISFVRAQIGHGLGTVGMGGASYSEGSMGETVVPRGLP
jgi:hypothetical protein